MTNITLTITLMYDGEPDPDDVRNKVDSVLEAARKNSQLSGDCEDLSCEDFIIQLVTD